MTRNIKFGECELDLGGHALLREGETINIEPVDYRVLVHLISHAPDYVSSNSLLHQNWPDTVVGDNSLHQVIRRLRLAMGDSARRPSYIQTLPRLGYRFIAPIENSAAETNNRRNISPVLAMPFHDYSAETTSPYLVEGLYYKITQQLRKADITVISPETIAHLRANAADEMQLCAVVGARSLLTGVVAQQGKRLRVSTKLSDVETGRLLWSETFDIELDSLFDAHSALAQRVAAGLNDTITNVNRAITQSSMNRPMSLSLWRASLKHMQLQGSPT